MRFFHRTTPSAAQAVLRDGFRDAVGHYATFQLTGVFISAEPLTVNEGAKGEELLALDTDDDLEQITEFEIVEEEKPYREWCVPATWINRRCRVSLIDEDEM